MCEETVTHLMGSKSIGFCVALLFAALCGFSIYSTTGIVGVTKKPNHIFQTPGCFCHGDSASPEVRVWIEGPDTLAPGQEALYTISVAKDSNIAAGFNVAAFFGPLGMIDSSGTQLLRPDNVDTLELTHTEPKFANGSDTISWHFLYRAPISRGVVDTIYANGNSVDLSTDPSGDAWTFADNFLIQVARTSSVADVPLVHSFRLLQNYPNPFNSSTVIHFELPAASRVRLTVFDIKGQKIKEMVNGEMSTGPHEAIFSSQSISNSSGGGSSLSSGLYFYQLAVRSSDPAQPTEFSATRKMLLLK
jgi:hypothetical protein